MKERYAGSKAPPVVGNQNVGQSETMMNNKIKKYAMLNQDGSKCGGTLT
jgi:hypothetical protein